MHREGDTGSSDEPSAEIRKKTHFSTTRGSSLRSASLRGENNFGPVSRIPYPVSRIPYKKGRIPSPVSRTPGRASHVQTGCDEKYEVRWLILEESDHEFIETQGYIKCRVLAVYTLANQMKFAQILSR